MAHIIFKSVWMLKLKTSGFHPAYQTHVNFDHPHKNESTSSLQLNQVEFDPPHWNQVTLITKTLSISIQTLKTVSFDMHTKTRPILTAGQKTVLTLKSSQFKIPTLNNVKFDPNAGVKSISIPALKTCQLCMPPDTKTKLTSIKVLNQVIFDPHTNQVNDDPCTEMRSTPIPHYEITSMSTTRTTTPISMPTLKPWYFRAVLLCGVFTPAHVFVIQQQYVHCYYGYQLVLFFTFPD